MRELAKANIVTKLHLAGGERRVLQERLDEIQSDTLSLVNLLSSGSCGLNFILDFKCGNSIVQNVEMIAKQVKSLIVQAKRCSYLASACFCTTNPITLLTSRYLMSKFEEVLGQRRKSAC